jgi:hypothetical protein
MRFPSALVPKPGYASTGTAQATTSLFGSSASVAVSQSAAVASASVQADYTLFVTGGSGTGMYKLSANGSKTADYVDEGYFNVTLGSTQLYADSGSYRVTNLYGYFTYGVADDLPFTMRAAVGESAGDRRSGSAWANFYGISIVNSDKYSEHRHRRFVTIDPSGVSP